MRIFLQAPMEQSTDASGSTLGKCLPVRFLLDDLGDGVGECLSTKFLFSRETLQQDTSKGPDVSPPVYRLPASLFRTHVGWRTQDHPLLCGFQRQRGGIGQFLLRQLWLQRLGQAKVQDLDHAAGSNLHVGRFQVSVNDALFVRGFQGLGNLQSHG